MEEVRHNCGLCVTHSLHDVYNILRSLQHRGREAFGIAAIGETIDAVKGLGKVDSLSLRTLYKILPKQYHTFLGHVRYATRGKKDIEEMLKDAHPIVLGVPEEKIFRQNGHIIFQDCRLVGVHNGQVDDSNFDGMELGELVTGTDTERLLLAYDRIKEQELMRRIPGAFTFAVAERGRDEVVVMRDRTGIKPGVLGWKDGKMLVASEDGALTENGAEFREELEPGTIYYLSADGDYRRVPIIGASPRHCFFEWNYIAHLKSTLTGLQVMRLRQELGRKLAEEFSREEDPAGIDLVTCLPTCSEVAAINFANAVGKQYNDVFYKKEPERAFQGSTMLDRSSSIERNLQFIPGIKEKIRGKRVVVIDDSTIRANNSRWARELLYKRAGVKEAFLLNYTPPIGVRGDDGVERGCLFGVDIPPTENDNHKFIARDRTIEQISEAIGMPVRYISVRGMMEVFEHLGIPRDNLCTYCIGGAHPFKGMAGRVELSVSASPRTQYAGV